MTSAWSSIRQFLQEHLSADEFAQWVQPVKARILDASHLLLQVPTRFHSEWIREHYLALMYAHCERERIPLQIRLRVGGKVERALPPSEPSHLGRLMIAQFQPSQTLATFVVAPFNQFAFAAAESFCKARPRNYNPLFIEGPPGLGKTHLLQAIGNSFAATRVGSALYMECRRLLKDQLASHHFSPSQLRQSLRDVEILLIDDVHLLPSDGNLQQYLLEIFNDLYDQERLLVFTATRLPQQIPDLLPGLRSRLSWGLIARIIEPEPSHRSSLVETLLTRAGIPSLPQLCEFLAQNGPLNFTALQKTVRRLKDIFRERREVPDFTQLQHLLSAKDTVPDELSMQTIRAAVCKAYNVSPQILLGSCKTRLLVAARQTGMYLARKLLGATYASIGAAFGNRDHSTVIYACRKVVAEIKRNRDFAELIVQIEKNLSISCMKEN
ncbi:MAG TPA: DnaA/Hda family protein [Syntrophobacteria bacterium]|nr:DnaA/Hda family protein [Syntrophobacteria bacterium]